MANSWLVGLVIVGVSSTAWGEVTPFPHRFSPLEAPANPIEKPNRDAVCLNGHWQFQPVDGSILTPPSASRWEKTPIRIPSPWNVNSFPVESRLGGDFRCFPSYPEAWERVQCGWLKRSFVLPKSWQGKRILLRFEAVAGDTQVLVNGKPTAHHFDIFLPFEVDITSAIRSKGENELLVGVRKASLTDRQGPYGRRTYQGGSMWGQAIVGIWQDVTLKAVPAVRVDDVFVKPDVTNGELTADVNVRNDTDHPRKFQIQGDVYPWINHAANDTLSASEPKGTLGTKSVLQMKSTTLTIPAHKTLMVPLKATQAGKALRTWTPEHPNLYGLVCRIEGDTKYTRFGWRQITFKGTKVLLNGEPLTMKGDSWHFMGIPQMTRRYAWAWFTAMHAANLNAVRLHAQPYPSFYLDMADEMGILVLDETAIWASDGGPKVDDSAYWSDTQRHLRELIHRDRNHPSVFGWSVSNEVMAVVRNVFHAPKSVEDQANQMNGKWAAICRAEDPTRLWISADGEEDGHGQLPVSVIHYGDRGTMKAANATGKPWGVGEAGPAYYGSPKQIEEMADHGNAYGSFEERMKGVALVSYRSLMDQREEGASYRSVFNLVWYGLKPLALGLNDTTRPPQLTDGIFFPAFVEGQPGVQPERLGPYCSTLNPGYDSRLPLYETWPLFNAIRAAQAEPAQPFPSGVVSSLQKGSLRLPQIEAVRVLAGPNGTLKQALTNLGAIVQDNGGIVFVDGANPPSKETKAILDRKWKDGGTVFVWGARPETLNRLNALLPRPLALTDRTASSLISKPNWITTFVKPQDLYFSELSPSTVLTRGLSGTLMQDANVILEACNTDWRSWNGQGETVKTAMVLRSEREAKPSGIALAEVAVGYGRLLICNLPVDGTTQMAALQRKLLFNLGVILGSNAEGRSFLDSQSQITSALVLGPFPSDIQPRDFAVGSTVEGRTWRRWTKDQPLPAGISYLTFWVYSPKSLDNLLLDPHLPNVELKTDGQVWLGGKPTKSPLLLQQGWNQIIVRISVASSQVPKLQFTSTQPDFLSQMRAVLEKP